MLAAVARPGARPLPAVGALVGAGLAVKAAAAAGFVQSPAPLAWLTPGVALGLVAGALLLYPLARLPRRALPAAAALCLVAGLAAVNLAPDNPYLNVPPRLLAGGASHLLSASAIARALSELWPFLALGCLAAAAARREPPVEHGHRL
jgi:peptidoglycan/LPS O-acetylase OafA/YrhL